MNLRDITFLPTEEYVKVLGRTVMLDDCRLIYLSGSGVEFTFTGNKMILSFYGDSSTEVPDEFPQPYGDFARIGVFIDGEFQADLRITKTYQKFVVFEADENTPVENHVVRIIKLSEPRMSGVGLGEITIMAEDMPKPTPKKNKLIEIVGDSITCGYGIDNDNEFQHFSTGTENVSKAYSYLTAQALDVDYSFISYSGHGFISGYTANPEIPTLTELIQPYYEIFAYSYNKFRGKAPSDYKWDFSVEPDIILINIGTNDESFINQNEEKRQKFEDAYVAFLEQVHRCNPNATIVSAYGVMTDYLYPTEVMAVERFKKSSGFDKVYNHHFPVHDVQRNGFAADFHPSKQSHKEAAETLVEMMKKII